MFVNLVLLPIRKDVSGSQLFSKLPTWINEGYCDYVAHESSFPEAQGLRLIAAGKQDPSGSFQYFIYRQMIRYLIEDRHFSFQEIVDLADETAAVKGETIKAIKAHGGNFYH